MEERRQSRRGLAELTVWVPVEKIDAVRRYVRQVAQRRAAPERDVIISALRDHAGLLERFGVQEIALFGSAARNQAQPHSDIDLLVRFVPGRPSGMFEMVDLKNALEAVLGHPVDLITADKIKPRIYERIMADAVPVPLPATPSGRHRKD